MLPKKSAEYIANNAEHVFINSDGVEKLADKLTEIFLKNKYNLDAWKTHELNPKSLNEISISWIFFMDTINFSFWPDFNNSKFVISYKNKKYTGYWSICAAVNRAIDSGLDITNANYMANITRDQFDSIFLSDNGESLPLITERINALREAGSILLEKFQGNFANCIKKANNSAQNLLQIIVDNFSSYRDVSIYKGQTVCIYKRAQILIADIWCCFAGKDFGEFYDINSLTAFADYRVPQVLAYFNAIQYSDQLKKHLDNKNLIENGHPWEVEIRGVTLHCIEMIVEKINRILNSKNICINSILVDNYLWDFRRSEEELIDRVPMHRTRTIYY